jgi:excisionase family DNA binding protein
MDNKRMFSVKQACNYLGLSRMTLLDAEERGLLIAERTQGGHRRYTKEMLESYLQRTRIEWEERKFIPERQRGFQLTEFVRNTKNPLTSIDEQQKDALRNLIQLLDVEAGAIYLFNSGRQLYLHNSVGIPHWIVAEATILGDTGISAEVIRRRQPYVYCREECEIPFHLEVGQGICTPLIYLDDVLGVVHVISSHRCQFFPSEINIVDTIAVYLASLIFSAKLLAQQQNMQERLNLLKHINDFMEIGGQIDSVLDSLLEETIQVTQANAACILLLDPSTKHFCVKANRGYPEGMSRFSPPFEEGITGWVVANNQPRISLRLFDDPLFSRRSNFLFTEIASNICLPLRSNGETIGSFAVAWKNERNLSVEDEVFLTTLGNQIAALIRHDLVMSGVAFPSNE